MKDKNSYLEMQKMFNQLLDLSDAPLPFESVDIWQKDISLKFKKHNFPWSITQKEYNFLNSIVAYSIELKTRTPLWLTKNSKFIQQNIKHLGVIGLLKTL